jgi:hypothetical protein
MACINSRLWPPLSRPTSLRSYLDCALTAAEAGGGCAHDRGTRPPRSIPATAVGFAFFCTTPARSRRHSQNHTQSVG